MRHPDRFVVLLAPLLLCSCSGADPGKPRIATAGEAITQGQLDSDHEAVVALLGPEHSCSGTVVATAPPELYLLTAAHCVGPHAPSDPEVALMGQDYLSPDASFEIEHCLAHPDYDGEIFDFAMCRADGASAATPFIPAAASPDGLEVGALVAHVGYGLTDSRGPNSLRNVVVGEVADLEELRLWYEQGEGGPCSGDSGGPQLATEGPERVLGVTSFGDPGCTEYGASGRVAAVRDSFIMPYVESSAGGGGAGGSQGPGAGASGAKEDGPSIIRGDVGARHRDPAGSCTLGRDPSRASRLGLWLLAACLRRAFFGRRCSTVGRSPTMEG